MKFHFFYSVSFWIAFLAILVIGRVFGRTRVLRWIIWLASSVLMILALPNFGLVSLAALLVLTLFAFGISHSLNRGDRPAKAGPRRALAALGIAGVLGFLVFFKYGFVQALFTPGPTNGTGPSRVIFMIGVSYFSFKMIHVIVESFRRKIERLTLPNFLLYVLFFPPFISGPINRYNPFAQQLEAPLDGPVKSDLLGGGERIVHGLFKKFVLAQAIHPYILGSPAQVLAERSLGAVLLGLYAYAFYFYFDFAGYSDLAIGAARMLGIQLPENFNAPFLKRNIRELWTNWHMSLTSWLVDYIYWPIVRKAREIAPLRERPVLLSNAAMVATFIACGMWHGEAPHFVVWGAYHGLGIAILTIYQRQKRKITHPWLLRYFHSKASLIAGTFLTFNFFAVGLAFFVLDLKTLGVLLGRLLP